MISLRKNNTFSHDKSYILDILSTALGVEKAENLWKRICAEHSIDPKKEEYSLEELEKLFISLIDQGGYIKVCGKSLLVRLASYTNLDK